MVFLLLDDLHRLDFRRFIGSSLRSFPPLGKERRLTFPSQRLVTEPMTCFASSQSGWRSFFFPALFTVNPPVAVSSSNRRHTCHISSFSGPSSPPPRVESRNISSTGLLVTWDPVPFRDRRGVLQGYDVACAKQTNGSTRSRKRVPVTVRHVTFTGLEKYTDYSCRVRAVNNFGNGTWSELVTVSTAEDGMYRAF